jgi:uncharacterized paraquat-inducible protein A
MPQFHCIHCAQHIDAPDELVGSDANCPSCGNVISVPNLQQQEPDVINFDELALMRNKRLKKKRTVMFCVSVLFLIPVYLTLMLAGPIVFVPAVLIALLLANVVSDEIVKYLFKKQK